ncbi:AGAP011280-PA [Anopheles gambiae str. PEST]|uniref:AGAP011280-PA n=2 Tax=gambiae species complex TaxID=44542 RepID=A0NBW0_ANOGA|nr:AGAP011280-PA [Anopheles gambiae str. PEST]
MDDDEDDDDFSGPALGGPVNVRSDSDDEDEPPTMGKMLAKKSAASPQKLQFQNQHHLTPNVLSPGSRKKPFRMEVVDF